MDLLGQIKAARDAVQRRARLISYLSGQGA